MNISQIKFLTWSASGLLGTGLALYVAWFATRLEEIQESVPGEELMRVLSDVDEVVQKSDDQLPYQQVASAVIDLNWTGRPPPVEVVVEAPPQVQQAPKDAVADLVRVMLISFDAEEPGQSRCVLRYTPKAQVRSAPNGAQGATAGWAKVVGDRLEAPLEHIRVAAILPDGIEFAFDEEGRANERVGPGEIPLNGLALLGDESELVVRPSSLQINRRGIGGPTPAKTELLGEGIYRLGLEDAQADWADLFAREVSWQSHRGRSGRPDGIQITQIAADSRLRGYGISTGDVIKSINGEPVTTPQEAVNFVSENSDRYTKWEVVIESMGREQTLVYYSPQE